LVPLLQVSVCEKAVVYWPLLVKLTTVEGPIALTTVPLAVVLPIGSRCR
jgi:hypothetical protein